VVLPDVHMKKPEIAVSLTEVGVTNLKMPIVFNLFEGKQVVVVPVFEALIDLPPHRKGIHASRSYEVVAEVFNEFAGKVYKLEDLCADIARQLLERHEYASRALVKANGEVIFSKDTPVTRSLTYDSFQLTGRAVARRMSNASIKVGRMIGVGIKGITVCPCAQELLRDLSQRELAKDLGVEEGLIKRLLRKTPIASHMQRSFGSITLDVPDGFSIDAVHLIRIIENSMSSSSFELLKRADEAEVVRTAIRRPRFVEDCIRFMIKGFLKDFPTLPDHVRVTFFERSEESVHKHDFIARRTVTLAQLRREVSGKTHAP